DKEQTIPVPNTRLVAPAKPTQQGFPKMKVVPPLEKEEKKSNSVQLFSKLFDEVEKIRCWKVQTDCDATEKERKLQESKRIIENQNRTIQELQFCNESLNMKLQEQADDNESLRNKNNATKNMCNILKDTFQRTAEKMQIFESEREETHNLFVDNNESIQKLIGAFESLRFKAEADQQEMQKVKENLLHFEDLKEKYHHDCNIKEKEVIDLQTKLKDKENELQKILHEFGETQKCCGQLQETKNEQSELLKRSKAEHDSLLQELHNAKQCCEETQVKVSFFVVKCNKNYNVITVILEQTKEENAVIMQNKDAKIKELNRVQDQQAEKLEQSQANIQELQKSLALETQSLTPKKKFNGQFESMSGAKALKDELCTNIKELDKRNALLVKINLNVYLTEEAAEQSAKKDLELKLLQDDLVRRIKIFEKSGDLPVFHCLRNWVIFHRRSVAEKLKNLFDTVIYNLNKLLKKQVAKEMAKSSQLQTAISDQQKEHDKLQKCHEEETRRLFSDLESKSALASELSNQGEKHKLTAVEAIKNKEETELKCQQKIDMVALMEKHKGHYERIVGEKDAELVIKKKKETETFANCKSLQELELESLKTDIIQLKIQLKTEVTEKENLLEKLSDMKKEMSSITTSLPADVQNKESLDSESKHGRCAETPKENFSRRYAFEFSKTPASKKDDRSAAFQRKTDLEDLKKSNSSRTNETSKIRSYRIKTPPSAVDTCWKVGTMDLDSKSDSSDQSDILSFAGASSSAQLSKANIVPKIRSPARQKSPEKLKLAAMKRMRDAGWTAVIGSDQKRKKINEKIFA
uniref:Synaptonemal complex protein 1 n=1 Tax=Tetraodon nigroviridis TaxID=99883 RepID=H3DLQ0_TETNG